MVVGDAYAGFNLVKYNSDYLLQNKAGLDGVSLLRSIQTVIFTDATVAIDAVDANRTVTATAPGVAQQYADAFSNYHVTVGASSIAVQSSDGIDMLVGITDI